MLEVGTEDDRPIRAGELADRLVQDLVRPVAVVKGDEGNARRTADSGEEEDVRLAATLALAFVAFRLCDIIKPWPARGLQRRPAGWGILLDDLASGAQTLLIVQAITRLAM